MHLSFQVGVPEFDDEFDTVEVVVESGRWFPLPEPQCQEENNFEKVGGEGLNQFCFRHIEFENPLGLHVAVLYWGIELKREFRAGNVALDSQVYMWKLKS